MRAPGASVKFAISHEDMTSTGQIVKRRLRVGPQPVILMSNPETFYQDADWPQPASEEVVAEILGDWRKGMAAFALR